MSFSSTNTYDFYAGNGTDTTFAITFSHTDSDFVTVEKWDVTDPDNPVQVLPFELDVDYTIASATVTCTEAPTEDEQLLIYRASPSIRDIDYDSYSFPYTTVNRDFDQLYQRIQELENALSRTIQMSRYEQATGEPLLAHVDVAYLVAQVADLEARVLALEEPLP